MIHLFLCNVIIIWVLDLFILLKDRDYRRIIEIQFAEANLVKVLFCRNGSNWVTLSIHNEWFYGYTPLNERISVSLQSIKHKPEDLNANFRRIVDRHQIILRIPVSHVCSLFFFSPSLVHRCSSLRSLLLSAPSRLFRHVARIVDSQMHNRVRCKTGNAWMVQGSARWMADATINPSSPSFLLPVPHTRSYKTTNRVTARPRLSMSCREGCRQHYAS